MDMDIRDRVKLASLLSEYGALLTDRQRDMLSMYVERDLSLYEVAEECGVYFQPVGHTETDVADAEHGANVQFIRHHLDGEGGLVRLRCVGGDGQHQDGIDGLYAKFPTQDSQGYD